MLSNNILLYLISIFILQSIRPGLNIVCNYQLNWAWVDVFSRSILDLFSPFNSLSVICVTEVELYVRGEPISFDIGNIQL